MCIRDRPRVRTATTSNALNVCYGFPRGYGNTAPPDPVSYTHLDVYKRQVLTLKILLKTKSIYAKDEHI